MNINDECEIILLKSHRSTLHSQSY